MATTVRITETFDLKTTVNKMGLVGVHTPTVSLLQKMYPGLMKNHRFFRFVKCDVVGACASVLPADPLQVGVSSGEIAPEDMFNPILYTAVSNSSFDSLVARIRALTDVSTLGSVAEGTLYSNDNPSGNFDAYYAFLAENGKFRKAMPQSGFSIKGLVPLCHTLISNYGNVGAIGYDNALATDGESEVPVPDMTVPTVDGLSTVDADGKTSIFFRGKSVKMPKIPLHVTMESASDIPTPNVPEIMVLAFIIPPAKLHEFYYRMRVTWTIRFEQVCSNLEACGYGGYSSIGGSAHGTNYTFAKSNEKLDNDIDMVSTSEVDIKKVMES